MWHLIFVFFLFFFLFVFPFLSLFSLSSPPPFFPRTSPSSLSCTFLSFFPFFTFLSFLLYFAITSRIREPVFFPQPTSGKAIEVGSTAGRLLRAISGKESSGHLP
ncbi:unnamed protein product [Cuscuta europaea]|uniref:Uncharacterized protein n=1 Tax=Cuscuta europaea TaxID=41803 RepID=A0A9P1ELE3_CUSEU|nr:unnamed protein product [Cuscuta europaea]